MKRSLFFFYFSLTFSFDKKVKKVENRNDFLPFCFKIPFDKRKLDKLGF